MSQDADAPPIDTSAAGLALARTISDEYSPIVCFQIIAAALGYTAASMLLHAKDSPPVRKTILSLIDTVTKNLKNSVLRCEADWNEKKN